MSFEDGSVVTAATQAANCEAISVSLECFKFKGRVSIEHRLCTMRSCVNYAVSFCYSVSNRVTILGL